MLTPELFQFFDAECDRLGPTCKRMGELREERGGRKKAIDYSGRFVDLWQDADPESPPPVTEVKGRMARLVTEGR
ncbi:MAG TPA: hypothetical protein VNL18_12995 [Gemmatimonadales bacterium]|nr:hypothetical protein [Gemmatimonadales bacterium]